MAQAPEPDPKHPSTPPAPGPEESEAKEAAEDLQHSHAPEEQTREWGDRLDTGKAIERGGKREGNVPGASEKP